MAQQSAGRPRPAERSRWSIHDERTQGLIFQVLVLALVVGLIAYLVNNTLINLERRQIKTGYGFLGREAGFEIGETLIAFSPASTYASALWVGFLNTLLVSVTGIVLATLLGIVVGIATLSRNWLVAKLTGGYIHFLRNIPVLLQIILWYTLFTEERFLPHPRRAEPVLGTYLTQRGFYFPTPEWAPGWTYGLVGLALALVGIWLLSRWARERQDRTGERFPVAWTGLGLLIVVPLGFWLAGGAPTAFSWPTLRGFNIAGGSRVTPELAAVLFGLTVYTSAFIGEIVRAGILAVPKGQSEAARALGLKEGVVLRKVVLPQALRVIIPPLTSQYLNLTKNSSLSVAVGYPDLVSVANTTLNQTGQAIEAISIIMIVYLTTSLVTSGVMNWYNARKQLVER
jgi:general L-amino acid transport system permease protein